MPTEKKTTKKAKASEKKIAAAEEKDTAANEQAPSDDATKNEKEKIESPKKKTVKRATRKTKKAAEKDEATKEEPTRDEETDDKPKAAKKEHKDLLFALDIGTRSVIGIVADREPDGSLTIIDTARQEHKTRAMLDGQIHDVPQVASVITAVKGTLEKSVGPLKNVAVAAAGRALYTMTADAEMEFAGVITAEEERRLDFAGVQAAQAKLAEGGMVDDPTRYYCVGYSTVKYTLDGSQLKTLVGQRGKVGTATVIATFLPRQVIDSMDSALQATNLEMKAITLEPIAAINVLIPPTMRHLNLVLVDIGAGTSDVAITKNGSVIAYGMVPMAGDEITEAISQKFLLDFNVAERIKREATSGKNLVFDDILGGHYEKTPDEVIEPILPTIEKLAEAIAKQIIDLNGTEPQAVLLVGGGALTPRLAEYVSKALSLTDGHVAVRHPDSVDGINNQPDILKQPDAVTPLGILKIASLNTLHFLTIFVGDEEYRLFNFRDLTVSDALLNAGIQLKKMRGKPGLGLQITVDGKTKFFPGTMGSLARLTIDGKETSLDAPIADGSRIEIIPGDDGVNPDVTIDDVIDMPEDYRLYINGHEKRLPAELLVNGEKPREGQLLNDGDIVTKKETRSIGEALRNAGYPPTGKRINFKLNGIETQFASVPDILVNDEPATLSMLVHDGDRIEYMTNGEPKLSDVLDLKERDTYLTIYFNGAEQKVPSDNVTLEVNERPASLNTIITEGCVVRYERDERRATLVSHALAAVKFEPPASSSGLTVELLLNAKPASPSDPIKNGDALDIKITPKSQDALVSSAPAKDAPPPKPELKQSLLGDYKDKILETAKAEDAKVKEELSPNEKEPDTKPDANSAPEASPADGTTAVKKKTSLLSPSLSEAHSADAEPVKKKKTSLLAHLGLSPASLPKKTTAPWQEEKEPSPALPTAAEPAKEPEAKPEPPKPQPAMKPWDKFFNSKLH